MTHLDVLRLLLLPEWEREVDLHDEARGLSWQDAVRRRDALLEAVRAMSERESLDRVSEEIWPEEDPYGNGTLVPDDVWGRKKR